MNEIRRFSPFWWPAYVTSVNAAMATPFPLLRDRPPGREVGEACRRLREPTTLPCGRSFSGIRWLRTGRAFTISIVGCNDIAEIPASEMRYSVLVVLVA